MERKRFDKVVADRAAQYGPEQTAARATGNAIRGLLEAHFQMPLPEIPPHVVHHIFVAIKSVRACLPFKFSEDNYIDAHNYLNIAERLDRRSNEKKNSDDGVQHGIRGNRSTKTYGQGSRSLRRGTRRT